jgi:hypothetical protein
MVIVSDTVAVAFTVTSSKSVLEALSVAVPRHIAVSSAGAVKNAEKDVVSPVGFVAENAVDPLCLAHV